MWCVIPEITHTPSPPPPQNKDFFVRLPYPPGNSSYFLGEEGDGGFLRPHPSTESIGNSSKGVGGGGGGSKFSGTAQTPYMHYTRKKNTTLICELYPDFNVFTNVNFLTKDARNVCTHSIHVVIYHSEDLYSSYNF